MLPFGEVRLVSIIWQIKEEKVGCHVSLKSLIHSQVHFSREIFKISPFSEDANFGDHCPLVDVNLGEICQTVGWV